MFKATVTPLLYPNSPYIGEFELEQDAIDWIAHHKICLGRLDERIVPVSDSYSREDVLEIIQEEIDGEIVDTKVRLRAQASYEIEDLSKNEEYVLSELKEKRRKEYPSVSEVIEALLESITENRPEKLNAIIQKRQEVKTKYPLK